MTLKTKIPTFAAALLATLALTTAGAVATGATTQHGKINTQKMSYDWLRTADVTRVSAPLSVAERKVLAARSARFGHGSWVCSPAGSGKRSQCYAR